MKNINIYICLRNNESTIKYTFDLFKLCEKIWYITYFIYENDSHDSTKSQVRNFMATRNGRYVCCTNNAHDYDSNTIGKIQYMASVRNKVRNLSKGFHRNISDMSVLIDSNVIFNPIDLKFMVDVLRNSDSYSMVTSFGHIFHNKHIYHDVHSLETIDKKNALPVTDLPSILEVNSAYGGLLVCRTSDFVSVEWDIHQSELKSEHYSFCRNMSKIGKIVILTNVKTIQQFK